MSVRPTQPLRDEHESLRAHAADLAALARDLPSLFPQEREAALRRAVAFVHDVLLAHVRAEELVLYPEWCRIAGEWHAAAALVAEHRAISDLAGRLARSFADSPELPELLYGLRAVIDLHLAVEEGTVLRRLDEQPPELVEGLLARVGRVAAEAHAG